MKRSFPALREVRHTKVCYSKQTYCGHASQSGLHNFGNGEIVIIHNHAICAYGQEEDVNHGVYFREGQFLLQRSLDHGETWKREDDVVVWDNAMPEEKKKAVHELAAKPGVEREDIDLTSPDAITFFKSSGIDGVDSQGKENHEVHAFRRQTGAAPGKRCRRDFRRRPVSARCWWMATHQSSSRTALKPWPQICTRVSWHFTPPTTTASNERALLQ